MNNNDYINMEIYKYNVGDVVKFIPHFTFASSPKNIMETGMVISAWPGASIPNEPLYTIRVFENGKHYYVSESNIISRVEKEKVQMKKSELQNRMIIEIRNGGRYMVVDGILVETKTGGGFLTLSSYNDDLEYVDFYGHDKDFDIVKVYHSVYSLRQAESANPIWIKEVNREMRFENTLDFIVNITDCLSDYKTNGADKVTITFKMK